VASLETLALHEPAAAADPWDSLVGFRLEGPAAEAFELVEPGAGTPLVVSVQGPPSAAAVAVGDHRYGLVAATVDDARIRVTLDGRGRIWDHAARDGERWVAAGPDAFALRLVEPVVQGRETQAEGSLEAPMPGTVLDVRVAAGEAVAEGQVLVVMESMKMELTLTAPAAATVAEVHIAAGDGVRQGQALVELSAETEDAA